MNQVICALLLLPIILLLENSCEAQKTLRPGGRSKLTQVDEYTLKADKHLVNDFEARTHGQMVQAVIEIPAGTNAKWEVDSKDGQLKWEFKNEKPRIVNYLPYLGNYGMIPRTLLSSERGGDGDPLDILVLGPALPRGAVVEVRLIGVLKFLDGGEQDDKLIAVIPGSPLGNVNNIEELKQRFDGVLDIIEIWFTNYKGPSEMVSKGTGDVVEANTILDAAIRMYDEKSKTAEKPASF